MRSPHGQDVKKGLAKVTTADQQPAGGPQPVRRGGWRVGWAWMGGAGRLDGALQLHRRWHLPFKGRRDGLRIPRAARPRCRPRHRPRPGARVSRPAGARVQGRPPAAARLPACLRAVQRRRSALQTCPLGPVNAQPPAASPTLLLIQTPLARFHPTAACALPPNRRQAPRPPPSSPTSARRPATSRTRRWEPERLLAGAARSAAACTSGRLRAPRGASHSRVAAGAAAVPSAVLPCWV